MIVNPSNEDQADDTPISRGATPASRPPTGPHTRVEPEVRQLRSRLLKMILENRDQRRGVLNRGAG